MVLGLTPEAYIVYYLPDLLNNPVVASVNGGLLFFRSYSDAKQAAEIFLASFTDPEHYGPPPYVWIQPASKLWINGVD